MNDVYVPSRDSQPVLFQRLRWRLFRNGLTTVMQGTPMRLVTIVLCSVVVWLCVCAASAWGFNELSVQSIAPTGGIVGMLFDLLFLALAIMLIFSTGIILYSSLFSTPETAFLLSMPAAADQVFAFKFQGAIAFSSWAFVLLGSPILIGYGIIFAVPWYFYVLLPFFFLGFILLPGSLGALLCLLIVNFIPRKRKQVLLVAGLILVCVCGLWLYRVGLSARDAMADPDALQRLFGQLMFAQGSLFPSHWMSRGLEAAARGDLKNTVYPLTLVWSNGLFLYLVVAFVSGKIYRRGYNRVATGGTLRKRYGGHWLDQAVSRLLGFLHPQTLFLIIKDFRTFRRDPAQWAQVLIFAGLLGFYTLNTRRFYTEDIGKNYQNGVSFVNLAAIAFLMCAYTGRFIFPMLSLEGRKFWILGLLPLERTRLLWGKFAFSTAGGIFISEILVLVSDLLLHIPLPLMALHGLSMVVLASGLSGLSVGLGACMPNFRESDPSKIAVGFGGTLNLVTGLLFLLTVISVMVAPSHFIFAAMVRGTSIEHRTGIFALISAGVALGLAIGFVACAVPLRMGARALRRMEF
jgi:ABC-2 type transport system permease protein